PCPSHHSPISRQVSRTRTTRRRPRKTNQSGVPSGAARTGTRRSSSLAMAAPPPGAPQDGSRGSGRLLQPPIEPVWIPESQHALAPRHGEPRPRLDGAVGEPAAQVAQQPLDPLLPLQRV